ncbi:MAG: AsmA-like C-terminal domain-containing protein [Alphaproteobacteria bacterium]
MTDDQENAAGGLPGVAEPTPRPLSSRLLRWTLEGAAAVTALSIVIGGAVVWQVQTRPIDISPALPLLEARLSEQLPEHEVEIGSAQLGWSQERGEVQLQLGDVTLRDNDAHEHTAPLVTLPSLGVELQGEDLFRGQVSARHVTLYRPNLSLSRDADGRLSFDMSAARSEDGAEAQKVDWQALLQRLSTESDQSSLAALEKITLADGKISFVDHLTGEQWFGDGLSVSLKRDDSGSIAAEGKAKLINPEQVELTLGARLSPDQATGELDLGFTNLRPVLLSRLVPDMGFVTALDMPLTGNLSADFVVGGAITHGQLSASGAGGVLTVPALFTDPVDLDFAQIELTHDNAEGSVVIDQLLTRFGPVTLTAAGHMLPHAEGHTLTLSARAQEVPFEELAKWWPLPVAPETRNWVTSRISDGTGQEATAHVRLDVPRAENADKPFSVGVMQRLDGTMDLEGLTVEYIKGFEPATGVDASVTYDAKQIRFDITQGKVAGMIIKGGDLSIGTRTDNLPAPIEKQVEGKGLLSGALQLEAPAKAVIAYLDQPQLDIAKNLGLSPDNISGKMDGELKIGFSLIENVTHEDLTLSANARARGIVVSGLPGGYDVREGAFGIDFAKGRLRVEGGAKLQNQPVLLDWRQWARGAGPKGAVWQLRLTGDLDNKARATVFGNSFTPHLDGSARIRADVTGFADRRDVALSADLKKASLSGFGLTEDKPRGEEGQAAVTLRLMDDGVMDLRSITLDLPRMMLSASGRLHPGADKDTPISHGHIAVEALRTKGGTNVGGRVEVSSDGRLKLRLSGPRLDLTHLPEGDAADQAVERGKGLLDGRAIEASAQLGTLLLKDRPSLGQLSLGGLRGADGNWQSLNLRAGALGGKPVDLRLMPQDGTGPAHDLSLTSEDASDLLKLFGKGDMLSGGKLRVTARWPNGIEGDSIGRLRLTDFTLVKAPALARLLSALSVTGLGDAMSGEGLGFSRFSTEFELTEDRLTLRDGRAAGNAFGLSIEGHFLREAERLDAQGTIVPAQTLNSVIGAIPLLGTVLTGGDGGGLFAASFTATGPIDKPKVSVNPLSTLAPGIIRRIFFVDEDLVADRPAEADLPAERIDAWDRNDR